MSNESLVNIYPPDTFAIYVGVGYITAGVVFIPLQLICSYIMYTHSEMQNPTYKLAAHLSLADAVELVPLCLYAGVTIIWGKQHMLLDRFMGFLCTSAWYATAILLPMIACTRWIAITKWHLVKKIFTTNTLRMLHLLPWIPMVPYIFWFMFIHGPALFQFYPEMFSFGFRTDLPTGEILHWMDFSISLVMVIIDMGFNAAALTFVHKMLHAVTTTSTTQNTRREILLLIQCFIISCVYTLLTFIFPLAVPMGWDSREESAAIAALWIFNHCVNPIVYFSINKLMRRAFVRFICRGKCSGTGATVVPQQIIVRKDEKGAESARARQFYGAKTVHSMSQMPTTSYM